MKINIGSGRITALCVGVLLMSLGGIARATLVEGFEAGLSESTTGDVGIKTTYHGIAPTEGTHQLLLTTINNTSDPGYSHEFADAVTNATMSAFFGVSSSAIRDGISTNQEGSGFLINLGTLNAGDTITLNYDFLTADLQNLDFAFWELNSGTIHVFADTNSGLLTPTSDPTNPFNLETGYQTLTISITATGNYTLGLGVSDGGDKTGPSGLLVDNIQVTPVPEPTTIAFSVAGAVLLVALRSRIKKTS